MRAYDVAIIGGGIVGLSTGKAISERFPASRVLVLEKEHRWADHQTGNNSGVIHSGIYYKPGSLKAALCREGNRSMVEFCTKHRIRHEVCGKVIVAKESAEVPLLKNLYQRGLTNGLEVKEISQDELREIEPHVRGRAALRVPSTGIVNYREVAEAFARLLHERGGDLRLNSKVERIIEHGSDTVLETTAGAFHAKFVVNCAGLHSDRVAQLAGHSRLGMRIVPFRGEYFELRPEKRYLVNHLVYPVPNPNFPFLGVHFTRMVDGAIHAGPNAVLSLKREGYRKTDINFRDSWDVLSYPAFWKLAYRNMGEGAKELVRSLSKAAFVRSLQGLVPEIQAEDIVPSRAGVRAQALMNDGKLADDFVVLQGRQSLHVCNAPSPAATASIEIGK
ncbi:MAG TPA: L-2-hydroxyglutarate oxidase, partial [Bacteroidota bacterium]|nr:L-2-hydroxyglutarate oxidase [Bacteroidota bacterium]